MSAHMPEWMHGMEEATGVNMTREMVQDSTILNEVVCNILQSATTVVISKLQAVETITKHGFIRCWSMRMNWCRKSHMGMPVVCLDGWLINWHFLFAETGPLWCVSVVDQDVAAPCLTLRWTGIRIYVAPEKALKSFIAISRPKNCLALHPLLVNMSPFAPGKAHARCECCEVIGKMMTCSICGIARYCSRACQKKYWKIGLDTNPGHKYFCTWYRWSCYDSAPLDTMTDTEIAMSPITRGVMLTGLQTW